MKLLESDDDPAAVLAALRALPRRRRTGRVAATSTSSATGRSTASTSRSRRRSSCPTRCSARSGSRSTGRDVDTGATCDDLIAGVRSKVPEEHRAEFDELLGEARLMYRLRDERGVYSDIWASGLMRRAALAAGRRARERGAYRRPGAHRRRRASTRCAPWSPAPAARRPTSSRRAPSTGRTHTAKDAPAVPRRPAARRRPTRRACRRASRRIMRATGIALDSLFGSSEAEHERGPAARPGREPGRLRRPGAARRRSRPSSVASSRATCC